MVPSGLPHVLHWRNSCSHFHFGHSLRSARALIPVVPDALADCSVAVLLFNAATESLGLVHVPRPVEPGDLLARAHGPALRVTVLVPLPGGVIEALAEVEPA
jgi:hypothetical protein